MSSNERVLSLNALLDRLSDRKSDQTDFTVGWTPAAIAWMIVRTIAARKLNRLLVLVPNLERLRSLQSDLQNIAKQHPDAATLRIEALPSWEISPYSSIALSMKTRNQRLSALESTFSDGPLVIIATPVSVAQSTLPKETFRDHQIRIKKDASIGSRDSILERLSHAGYLRLDPIEDPGTFAVRGEIIDVFPPSEKRPIRIELFDDTVEKIRYFDPVSQRTDADLDIKEIEIGPAREVLITQESVSKLRSKLKAFADNRGISRKIRDPIMHSIEVGRYPDHGDTWVPFTYDEQASFLDYWKDRPIFSVDPHGQNEEVEQFLQEQVKYEEDSKDSEFIVPSLGALFPNLSETSPKPLFSFDRLRDQDKDYLQVFTSENVQFQLKHFAPQDRPKKAKELLNEKLDELEEEVWIFGDNQSRLEKVKHLLENTSIETHPNLRLVEGALSAGFHWPESQLTVLTDSELLGLDKKSNPILHQKFEEASKSEEWASLRHLGDLGDEDLVVHVEHGIGIYRGLHKVKADGSVNEFLLIEYDNNDKLYLPVYKLDSIQKYVGGGNSSRQLDKLGGKSFEKTKAKVRASIKKLAFDLVELYAERKLKKGVSFFSNDGLYDEFSEAFPYQETPDQLKAIHESERDLYSGLPMDRLVCGDVGFGKTEVAMRLAYLSVINGYQVAFLAPTTVLTYQHEKSFKQRFKGTAAKIESLSRFRTRKEQKQVLEDLKEGLVDVVIGTHRLLSKDVEFKKLGLVIVDEEHRFGVEHKEILKKIKVNTHVLTLTATPIPRTLHMSLSGIRDISMIATPPVDRLPIRTFVSKFDDHAIKRAIEFEMGRGGQVFFLHNRVQSIFQIARKIQELVPNARIGVGHGQMKESELEKVMLSFYNKETDILVCTTIIESGLDIPNANTIIIDRADTFGLAQLYQLRGRVGRSHQRAYAYLLVSASGKMTEIAKRRLDVIQRFVELGSGFNVASYDLEIRGGGNLVGPEQSGHIASVGFELYSKLLEDAVREARAKARGQEDYQSKLDFSPEIKSPFSSYLDENYIPDTHQRLVMYRRLASATGEEELEKLEEEMRDRFGPVPEVSLNLIWTIKIKKVMKENRIDLLVLSVKKMSMRFVDHSLVNPDQITHLIEEQPERVSITPDSKLILTAEIKSPKEAFFALEDILQVISKTHQSSEANLNL